LSASVEPNFGSKSLTNPVRGPYCKLRTEFFPWIYGPTEREVGRGKREAITYRMNQEKEVSKVYCFTYFCGESSAQKRKVLDKAATFKLSASNSGIATLTVMFLLIIKFANHRKKYVIVFSTNKRLSLAH